MLGYVTIGKNHLSTENYQRYRAYYCGICKSIGRRCGQLSRMTLSYDAVFLAMILSALEPSDQVTAEEHCIIHPVEKRMVVKEAAVDYAADVMVILAYHKFLDDWKDEKSMLSLAGKTALRGAYRRLEQKYPEICGKVETALENLSRLEQENCGQTDLVAEAFADVMEPLFTGYSAAVTNQQSRRVLGELGRCLGRWIYIIDALDDYEKDVEKNNYNPLRFRENHIEGLEDLLYNNLAEIVNAYDLLSIKANQEIIENILFMGLRQRTDAVLGIGERENIDEESI